MAIPSTYDNGAYVIESFRDTETRVRVSRHRAGAKAAAAADTVPAADSQDTVSEVSIPAHSFRVFEG